MLAGYLPSYLAVNTFQVHKGNFHKYFQQQQQKKNNFVKYTYMYIYTSIQIVLFFKVQLFVFVLYFS